MATHALTENFSGFFGKLNPAPTWVSRAASQYAGITAALEGVGPLAPTLFLQGSYRRDTAIYTINDIDIVAMCQLWYPGSGAPGSKSWSRNDIFEALAAQLRASAAYAGKVRYGPSSLCIKLDLGIQVEVLPAVFKSGNSEVTKEPFYIYRPETGAWVEAFARVHQAALTEMNKKTSGKFIPAVKVFKHLRRRWGVDAVSFHIECLLHAFDVNNFAGGPADYIADVLNTIAFHRVEVWPNFEITTPAGDRLLFSEREWRADSWAAWYAAMANLTAYAQEAKLTGDRARAIQLWRWILGEDYFPG